MAANPDSAPRIRPLAELPAMLERAVELLVMPHTLLPLSREEAALVAGCMRLVSFPAGSTLLREGEQLHSDYLLLLLEGDVQVDTHLTGGGESVPMSVVGPGSIIGEMSVLDGSQRSATCTAMTAVLAAGLSRKGLELLIEQHPRAAAKLLMGLAQRLADRVRGLVQQIQIYAQLASGPPSGFGGPG